MARFLDASENGLTRELYSLCFPDREFVSELYGPQGEAWRCRMAVAEEDGRIVSMAQVVRRYALYEEGQLPVWYIMGVCTHPDMRHRGLMDQVMGLVLRTLRDEGEPWCFLIPVDRDIYRHLGFVHDMKLEDERSLEALDADDGLDTLSICFLCQSEEEVRAPRSFSREPAL